MIKFFPTMKSVLAIFIALSFAGVALLGFAMVNHSASHAAPDCFVSTLANKTLCPENLVSFVNYHASALHSLSQVLLAAGLILASVVLLPAFFSFLGTNFLIPLEYRRRISLTPAISRRRFSRWLALFELSPSARI